MKVVQRRPHWMKLHARVHVPTTLPIDTEIPSQSSSEDRGCFFRRRRRRRCWYSKAKVRPRNVLN